MARQTTDLVWYWRGRTTPERHLPACCNSRPHRNLQQLARRIPLPVCLAQHLGSQRRRKVSAVPPPDAQPAPFAAVLPRHVKAARHAQRAAPRRAQPPRTPAHAQIRQRRAPLARLGGHVRDERARVVRALRHVIKRVELCAAPLAAAAAAAARRGGRVADNDQAVAQFSMSLL